MSASSFSRAIFSSLISLLSLSCQYNSTFLKKKCKQINIVYNKIFSYSTEGVIISIITAKDKLHVTLYIEPYLSSISYHIFCQRIHDYQGVRRFGGIGRPMISYWFDGTRHCSEPTRVHHFRSVLSCHVNTNTVIQLVCLLNCVVND